MTQLVFAALVFLGLHFGVAGTSLRGRFVEKFGETTYRGGFSLLSVVGLVFLAASYRSAGNVETWGQLFWFKPFVSLFMVLAFLLVVLGVTTPNPTAVAGEKLLDRDNSAVGIQRITRHPMLWGIAVWAATHLIVNGDLASLVLFGSLLALALGGMMSIDNKRRQQRGEAWERYARKTSAIPFVAISQCRNRLVWSEIKWWQPLLALLFYAAVMHLHLKLFGVTPW